MRLYRSRLVLGLLAFTCGVRAEDFCAVRVHVESEDGRTLAQVPVTLWDPSGIRILSTVTDSSGEARICDFGFGPHRIQVGETTCHPVLIRNIWIYFPDPLDFRVRLRTCTEKPRTSGTCSLFLRIVGPRGKPVPKALIRTQAEQEAVTSDQAGRAFLASIADGSQLNVSAPGYKSETAQVSCGSDSRVGRQVELTPVVPQPPEDPGFCAVTVHVNSEMGYPVGARVDLVDRLNTTVVLSYADRKGIARFCDFGPGKFKIRVGGFESCGATEILNVQNRYPESDTFFVTLSNCKGEGDAGGNACRLYFRVQSEDGKPLGDVAFRQGSDPIASKTDSYGRVFTLLRYSDREMFYFAKDGYESVAIPLDCANYRQREEKIVLKNSQAR